MRNKLDALREKIRRDLRRDTDITIGVALALLGYFVLREFNVISPAEDEFLLYIGAGLLATRLVFLEVLTWIVNNKWQTIGPELLDRIEERERKKGR